MSRRRTQTAKYWVEDFILQDSDIEQLYNTLLEIETPLSVDEMALVLVRHRVAAEEKDLESKVRPGEIYKPGKTYQVDDELTFPQLGNKTGKVVDIQPGNNPDYGVFFVIDVEMEDGSLHQFASSFTLEHALNEIPEVEEIDDDLYSPEELFIEYGGNVSRALEARFAQQEELVRLAGRWFPRPLLADVNMGHLNLAEAVLDMNGGGPMSTKEILSMIGMMDGVNERLAEFSMNYGLQEDARFDEVGPAGQVLWYLVRMEPEDVRKAPERLAFTPQTESDIKLPSELAELETQIRDEHTPIAVKRGRLPESVKLTLTYPHRRAGTLPLSHELRRMFPTAYQAPRIRFTMVDGETEEEIPAWVVRAGGYVYGLAGWFENHDVPTGGYLTIERTDVPGKVRINSAARSSRKEWVLTARVDAGKLKFDNQQWPVACDYDELLIIAVEDDEAVDEVWRKVTKSNTPLESVMAEIGRELAHLNPQGNIHAKTFYSAVNLIKRCPPGPIFTTLIESRLFEHVGGPYFKMAAERA